MNISQIKSDVDFLCGSTSATYPDASKIRNINNAYQDVARVIWTSANGWEYDDSNYSTLPIAKTTLVHNQQDYSLPTTALRIERVQVKDNTGVWQKLDPISIFDMTLATQQEFNTPGLPIYYDLVGNSLMLYPTPASGSVTLSAGLQIFTNRSVSEFPLTAATTEPGFAIPFHKILSYAASIDFTQDFEQRKFLILQKDRLEKGMIGFYSKRGAELKTRILPAGKKRWRDYL